MQDFDFAGEWEKVKVPVKIRWGTNDWIMSESDNDMIVDALKKAGNKNVELVKYSKLDHWYTIHQSSTDSFTGKPGRWEEKISGMIVQWVNALSRK